MLIMSQDKNKLINLQNVSYFDVDWCNDEFNKIWQVSVLYAIDDYTSSGVPIGVYKTEERAKEVLKKIAEIQGGTSTYYMPEE